MLTMTIMLTIVRLSMRIKEREPTETPSTDLDCDDEINECNGDRIPPMVDLTVA